MDFLDERNWGSSQAASRRLWQKRSEGPRDSREGEALVAMPGPRRGAEA